jgi:hypothetical protein
MAFFQNLFDQEYQGYLLLADRKLAPTFKIGPNKNSQSKQIAWNPGPYDFSTNNILQFNFAWDEQHKNWTSIAIDVSGSNPSSTTAQEVVVKLNANEMFASMYVASVSKVNDLDSVLITKNSKKQNAKIYFSNSGAETKLGFNKNASVAELPEYFTRHTIENRNNYEDSAGLLIKLDPSDLVDQEVIQGAGFDLIPKQDYELLRGRSPGLFTFKKSIIDSNDRVTQIIEYPAGSAVGDFAKKTKYKYSGSNKNPIEVTEIPHVLEEADLIEP